MSPPKFTKKEKWLRTSLGLWHEAPLSKLLGRLGDGLQHVWSAEGHVKALHLLPSGNLLHQLLSPHLQRPGLRCRLRLLTLDRHGVRGEGPRVEKNEQEGDTRCESQTWAKTKILFFL